MFNYLREALKPDKDIKIIPLNWCASNFFHFKFFGWKGLSFVSENESLLGAIHVAKSSLEAFYSFYSEKFAFSEPILSIDMDSCITIKIATMELEEYEQRMGNLDEKDI